jgi:hypothetical protein
LKNRETDEDEEDEDEEDLLSKTKRRELDCIMAKRNGCNVEAKAS